MEVGDRRNFRISADRTLGAGGRRFEFLRIFGCDAVTHDPTDSGARGMVAIPLKEGMSAKEFRQAAAASSDANQARRLLALAAIRDGMSRQVAARIGGMDRQTLRDWVHAFNKRGMEGLINDTSPGRPSKLSVKQKAALKDIVEEGPDLTRDGVVRWRCRDLVCVVERRFGVSVSEDTIARMLHALGFSHITARPKHPEQKNGAIASFKKNSRASSKGR